MSKILRPKRKKETEYEDSVEKASKVWAEQVEESDEEEAVEKMFTKSVEKPKKIKNVDEQEPK